MEYLCAQSMNLICIYVILIAGGGGGGNGEKWRKMAMANLPFSFVKFAISPLAPPPLHSQ